jgi:hypothetical protein
LPAKDPFPLAIHNFRSAISGRPSVEEIEESIFTYSLFGDCRISRFGRLYYRFVQKISRFSSLREFARKLLVQMAFPSWAGTGKAGSTEIPG